MGCSKSKVQQEQIDQDGSAKCVFTLVRPRDKARHVEETNSTVPAEIQEFLLSTSETERENGHEMGTDEEVDEEFPFITENSAPALVNRVTSEFVDVDDVSDLVVIGTQCPRLLTGVQRNRAEEETIIETLRREGLISKPLGRTGRGMGFEIVDEKTGMNYEERASSSIAILEQSRDRFQKDLTTDSIYEKLKRAQERRMQQVEDEKQKRLRTGTSRHRNFLEERFQENEKLRLMQQEKWEQGLKKREEHLSELRDKLKGKHERIKIQANEANSIFN